MQEQSRDTEDDRRWRRDIARQVAALPDTSVSELLTLVDTLPENDYGLNMRVATSTEWISYKSLGLVVSLVGVHARAQAKAAEREAERRTGTALVAGHVGTVGEKLTSLPVHILAVSGFETQWGWTSVVTMRTEEGHCVTWMTSAAVNDLREGAETTIARATVKEHGDYRGQDRTMVKNVKFASAA
jgi:hypothetical protein